MNPGVAARRGNPLEWIGPRIRHAQIWLPGYLTTAWQRRNAGPAKHVLVMIADHFEPLWNRADELTATRRVQVWRAGWPLIAARHRDSRGRPPCYTFFYPQEEYRPALLDTLRDMVQLKIADVEIHIHHDGEGQQDFIDRIEGFKKALSERHGLLHQWQGQTVFGFIHGNWALDNSRSDGRWCGLNNEIQLLRDLGCYADFTMPSVPSETQARLVNVIYWAKDDPQRPKSYDLGTPVEAGGGIEGELMMIPGPVGLNWQGSRRRFLPKVETGELAHHAPPSAERVRLWLRHAPRLGDCVFLKLFAHGAQERNAEALLNGGLDRVFDLLAEECQRQSIEWHFVSAWQMWQATESYRQRQDPLGALGS